MTTLQPDIQARTKQSDESIANITGLMLACGYKITLGVVQYANKIKT